MIRHHRHLMQSRTGAGSAEFALVLPLLLILLFGIIDGGRLLYDYNKAEKATQVGARVAIVTNVLSSQLRDETYTGQTVDGEVIGPGDRIPAGALGTLTCTATACSCTVEPCPAGATTVDSATFNDVLVARMQQIYPGLGPQNVEVSYSGSGLGVAANVSGQMQISPLITVTLKNVTFTPLTSLMLADLNLPNFSTTLSAEDASGTFSN